MTSGANREAIRGDKAHCIRILSKTKNNDYRNLSRSKQES